MRKTFLLALILSAAALLLLPLAPANTTPLSHTARNLLGSLRPAAQDPSVEQSPSVPAVPPIPPIHVHIDPPEIGPVEVDIDPQEIEQDPMEHDDAERGDADREDFDHVEIDHDDPDFNVRAEEKIEKSSAMPAAHRSLEIDNVWGSIEVVGTSSDQARLTVNKSFRAESKEKLEQARKDVTLDITQQPDSLKLYVNGPFRCDCRDCNRSRDHDGYIVKMDFQLQVPRDIDIKIKTLTGPLTVRAVPEPAMLWIWMSPLTLRTRKLPLMSRTETRPSFTVLFRQNPK